MLHFIIVVSCVVALGRSVQFRYSASMSSKTLSDVMKVCVSPELLSTLEGMMFVCPRNTCALCADSPPLGPCFISTTHILYLCDRPGVRMTSLPLYSTHTTHFSARSHSASRTSADTCSLSLLTMPWSSRSHYIDRTMHLSVKVRLRRIAHSKNLRAFHHSRLGRCHVAVEVDVVIHTTFIMSIVITRTHCLT